MKSKYVSEWIRGICIPRWIDTLNDYAQRWYGKGWYDLSEKEQDEIITYIEDTN